MIGTVEIKQQQLSKGYFEVGSGKEKILVMGSCRVCHYVSFLNNWNIRNGNRFTIYSLDPFNNNWDKFDERVDYEQALLKLESNAGLLSMLESVDYFFHEHYKNSGLFNVNKNEPKTIYQFGMNPKIDVCIPSWNDVFVLFKDIFSFDLEIRKNGIQDINVIGYISEQTQNKMFDVSQKGLNKFYQVCLMSDIPEMADYFKNNFVVKRLWHTYNHTNLTFAKAIFDFIDKKFLNLNLPENFYDNQVDIFANSFTPLTEYDLKWYNYEWNEEIKPIL